MVVKYILTWNNGIKDSIRVFSSDGNIHFIGNYQDGELSNFQTFYSNGQIKYNVTGIFDFKAKEIKFYSENGEIKEPREREIGIIGWNEKIFEIFLTTTYRQHRIKSNTGKSGING